ncbi:unnamed protein product [Rangifer tarandus platyrhynchus]|uniref:Uncharacterized protein n=1 Tax=Rangifer tarandus platyrhynchus TaxID=3082113 RepID=A0ACB1KG66_RANTA
MQVMENKAAEPARVTIVHFRRGDDRLSVAAAGVQSSYVHVAVLHCHAASPAGFASPYPAAHANDGHAAETCSSHIRPHQQAAGPTLSLRLVDASSERALALITRARHPRLRFRCS